MREPEPRDRDRPATPDETITTLARPAAQVVPEITDEQRGAIRRQVDHLNRVAVSGGAISILALDKADAERDATLLAPLCEGEGEGAPGGTRRCGAGEKTGRWQ